MFFKVLLVVGILYIIWFIRILAKEEFDRDQFPWTLRILFAGILSVLLGLVPIIKILDSNKVIGGVLGVIGTILLITGIIVFASETVNNKIWKYIPHGQEREKDRLALVGNLILFGLVFYFGFYIFYSSPF
jgi:hypothetical protein